MKLDGGAPLVKGPSHAKSTTRPNQPICNPPLYVTVTSEQCPRKMSNFIKGLAYKLNHLGVVAIILFSITELVNYHGDSRNAPARPRLINTKSVLEMQFIKCDWFDRLKTNARTPSNQSVTLMSCPELPYSI